MKYLFPLVILLFSFAASSQVVIDNSDMPAPGDTLKFNTTNNLAGINYQQTGADFIWNFSSLSSMQEATDTFVSVLTTNLAYLAVFDNILDPDNMATVALRQEIPAIPFVPITISDAYNFYRNSASRYSMLGMGAKVNGVPLPMKFDNPDVLYHFPVTFGSADTSDSEFHVNIPNIGYYGEARHRENFVDGWGTLYLPTDTFSVMRIKSKVTYYDSIYSDSIGYGIGMDYTVTEYKWLSDEYHEPVLQINKRGQNNVSARYYNYVPPDLSVETHTTSDDPVIYPNPADNYISITFKEYADDFTIIVCDLEGRELIRNHYSGMLSRINLPIEKLDKGIYLVHIISKSLNTSAKFIKY